MESGFVTRIGDVIIQRVAPPPGSTLPAEDENPSSEADHETSEPLSAPSTIDNIVSQEGASSSPHAEDGRRLSLDHDGYEEEDEDREMAARELSEDPEDAVPDFPEDDLNEDVGGAIQPHGVEDHIAMSADDDPTTHDDEEDDPNTHDDDDDTPTHDDDVLAGLKDGADGVALMESEDLLREIKPEPMDHDGQDDEHEENEEPTDELDDADKEGEESSKRKQESDDDEEKANKKKKSEEEELDKKKNAINFRRNIREVMDEAQLDEATLSAQRQEAERLRRVQEQQKYLREMQMQRQIQIQRQNRTQSRVMSLLQGGSGASLIKANQYAPGDRQSPSSKPNTVVVKLGSNGPPQLLNKKVLEAIRGGKSSPTPPDMRPGLTRIINKPHMVTPSVSIAPVKATAAAKTGLVEKKVAHVPPDVVTISSSDDDEEHSSKPKMMMMTETKIKEEPVDEDDDDDCIVISEPSDEEEEEEVDTNNSGMHTNDLFNTPDEQGRVLINVGKQDGEKEIFLAPQICRVIKPHQIGGIRFLFDNIIESAERYKTSTGFGCILAHSMGLGKTLQVVSFCDVFLRETPGRTIMCIMPINTLQNWMAEFNMWLPTDPSTSPLAAQGEVRPRHFHIFVLNDLHKTIASRAKVVAEWQKEGGVLLIGYEMYRQLSLRKGGRVRKGKKKNPDEDMDDDKNKPHLENMHEALVKPGPDLVICDEGHRIKNSHASISHALKQIRTKRRVVLTGYPLQNNLLEYWCMVDFVRPNYLGTKTEFSNMFERPIQNGQCIDSTPQDIRLMRYRAHVLHSLLEGFVQRRSHSVLRNSLPQKEEYVMLIRMNEFQRKLYDTFMNEVVRTKAVPNPLKAFAVCCKIWNHPDILYNFLKKRELDELQDLDLEETANLNPNRQAQSSSPRGKGEKGKKGKGSKKAPAVPIKPAATVPPTNSQPEMKNESQNTTNMDTQSDFAQPPPPENYNGPPAQGEYNYNQNYNYNYNQNYNAFPNYQQQGNYNYGSGDYNNYYQGNNSGNFGNSAFPPIKKEAVELSPDKKEELKISQPKALSGGQVVYNSQFSSNPVEPKKEFSQYNDWNQFGQQQNYGYNWPHDRTVDQKPKIEDLQNFAQQPDYSQSNAALPGQNFGEPANNVQQNAPSNFGQNQNFAQQNPPPPTSSASAQSYHNPSFSSQPNQGNASGNNASGFSQNFNPQQSNANLMPMGYNQNFEPHNQPPSQINLMSSNFSQGGQPAPSAANQLGFDPNYPNQNQTQANFNNQPYNQLNSNTGSQTYQNFPDAANTNNAFQQGFRNQPGPSSYPQASEASNTPNTNQPFTPDYGQCPNPNQQQPRRAASNQPSYCDLQPLSNQSNQQFSNFPQPPCSSSAQYSSSETQSIYTSQSQGTTTSYTTNSTDNNLSLQNMGNQEYYRDFPGKANLAQQSSGNPEFPGPKPGDTPAQQSLYSGQGSQNYYNLPNEQNLFSQQFNQPNSQVTKMDMGQQSDFYPEPHGQAVPPNPPQPLANEFAMKNQQNYSGGNQYSGTMGHPKPQDSSANYGGKKGYQESPGSFGAPGNVSKNINQNNAGSMNMKPPQEPSPSGYVADHGQQKDRNQSFATMTGKAQNQKMAANFGPKTHESVNPGFNANPQDQMMPMYSQGPNTGSFGGKEQQHMPPGYGPGGVSGKHYQDAQSGFSHQPGSYGPPGNKSAEPNFRSKDSAKGGRKHQEPAQNMGALAQQSTGSGHEMTYVPPGKSQQDMSSSYRPQSKTHQDPMSDFGPPPSGNYQNQPGVQNFGMNAHNPPESLPPYSSMPMKGNQPGFMPMGNQNIQELSNSTLQTAKPHANSSTSTASYGGHQPAGRQEGGYPQYGNQDAQTGVSFGQNEANQGFRPNEQYHSPMKSPRVPFNNAAPPNQMGPSTHQSGNQGGNQMNDMRGGQQLLQGQQQNRGLQQMQGHQQMQGQQQMQGHQQMQGQQQVEGQQQVQGHHQMQGQQQVQGHPQMGTQHQQQMTMGQMGIQNQQQVPMQQQMGLPNQPPMQDQHMRTQQHQQAANMKPPANPGYAQSSNQNAGAYYHNQNFNFEQPGTSFGSETEKRGMSCQTEFDKDEKPQEKEDGEEGKKDDEGKNDDEKKTGETQVALPSGKASKEDLGIPYDWATELLKGYVPGDIESSNKMTVFFCILEESIALGDRILVFSQSLFTLNLMEELLQRREIPGKEERWARNLNYYRLDGSTTAIEREKLINEFNSNPKLHLFLVSTRAGSLGINLVGANRVIVFDASWNPCHDTQAVCRVYRYGQKKPCFVYRLVTDNCLEKKIYDRQINKQGMSDRVVDECNPDAHLSIKEVTSLCWDDKADDTEVKDFTDMQDQYIDVVIQKVLQRHSKLLSKEPFAHESLLVDRKEKKLSQAEKRLAKRSYELEKQASGNNRPVYQNNIVSNQGGVIRRGDNKPMASVRPMQSEMGANLTQNRPRGWIPASVWQRQGMSAQEMTLPLDVVIPTNAPDRSSIVLKAGQKVMVLKSPKGIYMQLENGKIIAIRTAFKPGGTQGSKDGAIGPKKNPGSGADARRAPIIPSNLRNNSAVSITPRGPMTSISGAVPGRAFTQGNRPVRAVGPTHRPSPVSLTVTKKRPPPFGSSQISLGHPTSQSVNSRLAMAGKSDESDGCDSTSASPARPPPSPHHDSRDSLASSSSQYSGSYSNSSRSNPVLPSFARDVSITPYSSKEMRNAAGNPGMSNPQGHIGYHQGVQSRNEVSIMPYSRDLPVVGPSGPPPSDRNLIRTDSRKEYDGGGSAPPLPPPHEYAPPQPPHPTTEPRPFASVSLDSTHSYRHDPLGHGESGGPRVGEQTSEPSGAEQSKRAFQPYPQGPPYQPHHPSPMDKGSTPYNPYHVDKPSGAYDAEKVLLRPPHQPQLQHQHQSQHQGQMHQSHPAEQAHPEQHPEQLRHPRHEHEAKHLYHHRASQPPHQQLPQQHQSMPQHQAPAPHQAPLEEERYRGDKPPMYHPPNRPETEKPFLPPEADKAFVPTQKYVQGEKFADKPFIDKPPADKAHDKLPDKPSVSLYPVGAKAEKNFNFEHQSAPPEAEKVGAPGPLFPIRPEAKPAPMPPPGIYGEKNLYHHVPPPVFYPTYPPPYGPNPFTAAAVSRSSFYPPPPATYYPPFPTYPQHPPPS